MKHIQSIFIVLFFYCQSLCGQHTQFVKGFILPVSLQQGVVTNFKGGYPDMYVLGLGTEPQVTVVPGALRAGLYSGLFYTSKQFTALAGPQLSYRLSSFKAGNFGTVGNLHLLANAAWGTEKEQMISAGAGLEFGQKVHIQLNIRRDYHHKFWWISSGLGINLIKQKEKKYNYH